MKHKKIAYGGIFAALNVILVCAAAYAPTSKAALLFVSSLNSYAVSALFGAKSALMTYAASAALSALLVMSASPGACVLYIAVLGIYPILRFAVGKKGIAVRLVVKAAYFCVCIAAAYAVVSVFKIKLPDIGITTAAAVGTAAVVFVLYDLLTGYAGDFFVSYIKRIKK